MTPDTARHVVTSYKRHEDAAGGYAFADMQRCLVAAAEECGVTVEEDRSALLDSPLMAGNVGRG